MLPSESTQYDALGQFIGTKSEQKDGGTLFTGTKDGKSYQRFVPGISGNSDSGRLTGDQYDSLGQFIGTSSKQINGGTLFQGTKDGKPYERFVPGINGTTQNGMPTSEPTTTPAVITAADATKDLNNKKNTLQTVTSGIDSQNQARSMADKTPATTKEMTDIKAMGANDGNPTAWSNYLKSIGKNQVDTETQLNEAMIRVNNGTASETDKDNLNYAMGKGWRPQKSSGKDVGTGTGTGTNGSGTDNNGSGTGTGTGTNGTGAGTDTNGTGTGTSLFSNYQKKLDDINTQLDTAWQSYSSQINQIKNGTFPLTSTEQAQIDQVNQSFNDLIAEQKVANQNYTNGVTKAGVSAGREKYASEINSGIIFQSVSDGLSKIKDIESKALAEVTKLKEGFETKNYDLINKSFTAMQSYLKDKSSAINTMSTQLLNQQKLIEQQKKDDIAAKTAELNQTKLNQEISGSTLKNVIPSIAAALTGDSTKDSALIDAIAKYYGFDANAIRGQLLDYKDTQTKQNLANEKASQAINKTTTKTVKIGTGKNTQTYLITYNASGKEVKREKMNNPVSSSGSGSTKKKQTDAQKRTAAENSRTDKVNQIFNAAKGGDNYVSPEDWNAAKNAYEQDGGNPTTFTNKFKGWKNPNNKNY